MFINIRQKNRDKQIWEQWLALFPLMTAGMLKFVEFEDFKNRVTGSDIDTRPIEEIMADVEEVRRYIG